MSRTLFLIPFLIFGCGRNEPEAPFTVVDENDPAMRAAVIAARNSAKKFIAAFTARKAGTTGFSIKKPFKEGEEIEHIWLTELKYDGSSFSGKVNNQPKMVTNVKMGQRVSVAPSDISDWMYIENGKLVGGFTLRVLRDAMSEQERAEFDKSIPFSID